MVEDLRSAASKMTQAERRAFQAQMFIKYCGGSARPGCLTQVPQNLTPYRICFFC